MMNTDFFIEVPSTSENWKEPVSKWLQYVAQEWSRFIPNNELDQINQLPIGKSLTINASLYDCLKKANDFYEQTKGFFSPYLKNQLEKHGYNQSFPFNPVESYKERLDLIVKDPLLFLGNQQIYKTSNQPIDLGGFAKGYAVEQIKKWLKIHGFSYGIVDGGGDMAMWSDGEKEWYIGIADPFDRKNMGSIKIQNGAIATSNRVYRSWIFQHKERHHILNGQTGKVAETNIIQATVITDSLYKSEVAAKLCFLMNEQQLNEWLVNSGWRVARFMVDQDETTKWIKIGDGEHV